MCFFFIVEFQSRPCYCSCSTWRDVFWRSNLLPSNCNMTGKVDIKSNYTFDKCLVSRSAGRSHNHLSTRLPETVKQTPAKPQSRSQAKTLPVSSGLWTQDVHSREGPPLGSPFYLADFLHRKSEKDQCSFGIVPKAQFDGK